MTDPYKVLGISKSAGEDDIKKAYRRLAIKFHPDKNQGDKQAEERFKEIAAAYEILSDPSRRQKLDHEEAVESGEADTSDLFKNFDSLFEPGQWTSTMMWIHLRKSQQDLLLKVYAREWRTSIKVIRPVFEEVQPWIVFTKKLGDRGMMVIREHIHDDNLSEMSLRLQSAGVPVSG